MICVRLAPRVYRRNSRASPSVAFDLPSWITCVGLRRCAYIVVRKGNVFDTRDCVSFRFMGGRIGCQEGMNGILDSDILLFIFMTEIIVYKW